MTIENFIAEVNANTGLKGEVCRRHVIKKYVPFLSKVLECERIIKATMEIDGTFRQNTPARYLQFTMILIKYYTDLEIDDGRLILQYDQLNGAGLMEALHEVMPADEVKEFTTLLSMTADDYFVNSRSVAGYIDKMMTSLLPKEQE